MPLIFRSLVPLGSLVKEVRFLLTRLGFETVRFSWDLSNSQKLIPQVRLIIYAEQAASPEVSVNLPYKNGLL